MQWKTELYERIDNQEVVVLLQFIHQSSVLKIPQKMQKLKNKHNSKHYGCSSSFGMFIGFLRFNLYYQGYIL